jgi:hypothetical protein
MLTSPQQRTGRFPVAHWGRQAVHVNTQHLHRMHRRFVQFLAKWDAGHPALISLMQMFPQQQAGRFPVAHWERQVVHVNILRLHRMPHRFAQFLAKWGARRPALTRRMLMFPQQRADRFLVARWERQEVPVTIQRLHHMRQCFAQFLAVWDARRTARAA